MNFIMMICYRVETAIAQTIVPYFYKKNENRMLTKQLFSTLADIITNEEEQTLTITIARLSTPGDNEPIRNYVKF